jgi:hypothetical protein
MSAIAPRNAPYAESMPPITAHTTSSSDESSTNGDWNGPGAAVSSSVM